MLPADLTQMTFGYSRDDAGTFLPFYICKGILHRDPFQQLDEKGEMNDVAWVTP